MAKNPFTVSEVARDLKEIIEDNFSSIRVSGELSNAKLHSSGHFYFTLKDDAAQLSGVMWRGQVGKLKFRPEDGMKVIVAGHLSFYPPQGKTQFYAEEIEPDGVGALQLAFEQLKKRLAAEGLFADERKRPLPMLPAKIGIITSETGAVIHDLIQNLRRRHPQIDIVVAPAKVQGDGAAKDIAEKILIMNTRDDIDVLIVGRGGGSLEDLWAFNEEIVARAIFHSRIPVISAVGHESDFTIADFVADVRASTPTAAAELAVPVLDDLLYTVEEKRQRLTYLINSLFKKYRERLRYCNSHMQNPRQRFRAQQDLHRYLSKSLTAAMMRTIETLESRHRLAKAKLMILSPQAVLDRGYAIVFREDTGSSLKDAAEIASGELLDIQLARGRLRAQAKK